MTQQQSIPGTMLFDGEVAQRGYALNKMCFSLNLAVNRESFLADPEVYMDTYNLTPEQRAAVRERDVLAMLDAGGNVYYLAKLAGAWGLGVQDIGALQTGVSVEEFKRRLVAAGS
jgi:protocatechuate 4,5-dioxygenase, alpha chain